jgi:hypothetical protein
MAIVLARHPESQGGAGFAVRASATRLPSGLLGLSYRVEGPMQELLLPSHAPPERVDHLWRRTCFEAFVKAPAAADYLEFNISPSSQWSAYRFSDYRHGREDLEARPPGISAREERGAYEIEVELAFDLPPSVGSLDVWRLGLSTVLETSPGVLSYWALAHPPGKPDFHHPDSFVLVLPPPATIQEPA